MHVDRIFLCVSLKTPKQVGQAYVEEEYAKFELSTRSTLLPTIYNQTEELKAFITFNEA